MRRGTSAPAAWIVVTTIEGPAFGGLRCLAACARRVGSRLLVIGDASSPGRFLLRGCDYYDVERQRALPLSYPRLCPLGSYARKNVGFLVAAAAGAESIVETDDDNYPRATFASPRSRHQRLRVVRSSGWINVYRYFTDSLIWPRGLPLTAIRAPTERLASLPLEQVDCPIQQGLVAGDADVDSVYRLVVQRPVRFAARRSIALAAGGWSPINSQNTTWFRPAFPLMYLPATCSMRLTDVWRGLVAQRIAWECGWCVCFHSPTVVQRRRAHDLGADFRQEMPAHLHNDEIRSRLAALALRPGEESIAGNLTLCYAALVSMGHLQSSELELLAAWLADLASCPRSAGE